GIEGCLSFPGLRADITRPFSVRVKAQDLEGKTIEFEADGLLARAVQHEHDHLHGLLFIDRMEPALRKEMNQDIEDLRTV
ncbi:MAG: peptide deformylase, partial [Terrimicrobiaceae bacterium]